MKPADLVGAVNDVLLQIHDPERAHGMEDDLHMRVIRQFCPEWVVAEVERLADAPFSRWCA